MNQRSQIFTMPKGPPEYNFNFTGSRNSFRTLKTEIRKTLARDYFQTPQITINAALPLTQQQFLDLERLLEFHRVYVDSLYNNPHLQIEDRVSHYRVRCTYSNIFITLLLSNPKCAIDSNN